jgi:long-subunit fatty acid transport protein
MKKITIFSACMMLASLVFAGGVLTNTNQSVQYVRMLSRNASTGIDAVYFNPAGLTSMKDGWHFGLSSQTIFQKKPVQSNFPLLNDGYYEGLVNVPVFPTAFGVYKMDRLAISLGIGPNAGGGSAAYSRGLPSFEIPLSKLPLLISSIGVPTSQYDVDMNFEGSSVFWGIQVGAAYEISDFFSASLGVRVLPATNKYTGYIRNIEVNPTHPLINPTGAMISAFDFFSLAAPTMAGQVADKEVETTQTGFGFTPIVGINIIPAENFNIALKYEMKTTMNLTNNTTVDDLGLFPDGDVSSNDIPAILGVGAGYKTKMVDVQLSYNMYFNKGVGWGPNTRDLSIWRTRDPSQIRAREFEKNGMEISLGAQFNVSREFAFSVGSMYGHQGMADSYQSDFSFSNPHITFGGGIEWKLSKALTLDAGLSNSIYQDQTVSYTDPDAGVYTDVYSKSTFTFAFGISYSIF